MKKAFVDTSYVVALVNERDELHEKANELVIEFDNEPIITTDAVLLEVGNSLTRNSRQKSVEVIDEFLSSKEVEIIRLDESLFGKAFELYKTHSDKTWGLVDCISFVVMRENGVTDALTSDRHFVQAGFRALLLDAVN